MNEAILRVIGASPIPDPVLRAVCGPKIPSGLTKSVMEGAQLPGYAPPALPRQADPAAILAAAVIESRGIRVTEQEAVATYREIRRLMESPNE